MRVEAGRIPDVETFGKLCKWLGVGPGSFLGFAPTPGGEGTGAILVSAHLKADSTPDAATIHALARMIQYVASHQRATLQVPGDVDA